MHSSESLKTAQTLLAAATAALVIVACLAPDGVRAEPSIPSKSCADETARSGPGDKTSSAFYAACKKGALAPTRPTAPTGPSRAAKAVTAPSGADRTVRSKQCSNGADKRGLTGKERKSFRLSCLATAGPVSESQSGTTTPKPAKQIDGLGTTKKPS